ncbi:MAG: hypothetical protein GTN38_03535 [Candidatus Aenigmarchaeota archaeon]|nr:hypothetical protein [Candidatus Aenigmarchaeota archaeon]NIP40733.1 hypothetical protein [Candidatus Aenigmarchaeota archaeon]NIQ18539.1 hypothetical protein [Candidatus Aenigmarchaeota archaeon]NIS73438.1 hypothetical protein [Candidatus Aenigmarchaeota archaeon]
MTTYKIRLPRKTSDHLAFFALAIGAAGGLGLVEYNNYANAVKAYNGSEIQAVECTSGVAWNNYMHEPIKHSGLAWGVHQDMLEKVNGGKKMHQFDTGEEIKLFDMVDPETGKPDGMVLPEGYSK